MTDRFDDLALKLLPPGGILRVVVLRQDVAELLRDEVHRALQAQQDAAFPDVAAARKSLDDRCIQIAENEHRRTLQQDVFTANARTIEAELAKREAAIFARESALKELLTAFEDYESWQRGEGDVDEVATRYRALREAVKEYRERSKGDHK